MKKEITILLIGLVTGAGILHLLETEPVREVQLDIANNTQSVMTSAAVTDNTRRGENGPTRENSERATHDYPEQPSGKSESSPSASPTDPYQATTLQLAKIADNAQWAQSFQGNYSPEAEAANKHLTQLADTFTRQFGSYYTSGCNQQFCAMLLQGFTEKQQAEEAIEQMLISKQLPNFKFYRLMEDETGIAVRFSIPIDKNYTPTTAEWQSFSDKFKPQSP
ncbi:hypothetical protein [Rheinheimera sp. F8]|uniref:hypothetical protein n=1 Tax=Rheinheimera sp. F8 TaxID=1763998 RepID=UPI0007448D66|nr:hypothetical protein [Rheinheimera sp. F8]ALZ76205.1 hypothetical protein ATY27_10830 [Rheinheimera sp. F8]ALZ77614.1 hypothetical protein ATY27_18825 [Rheinheimera sp. F8]